MASTSKSSTSQATESPNVKNPVAPLMKEAVKGVKPPDSLNAWHTTLRKQQS